MSAPMKRRRTRIAMASLVLAALAATPSMAQELCPASEAQWIAWRDQAVDQMLTPSDACADFGVAPGQKPNLCTREPRPGERFLCRMEVATKGKAILGTIERCNPSEQVRDHLLGNLIAFTSAVGLQFEKGHSHGYSITDQEFVEYAAEPTKFPDLLASQDFLQKISDPQRYHEALQLIEERNAAARAKGEPEWTTLLYDAPFLPSPDCKTYGQFMIHVPGEVDKWIQFGILTPEAIPTSTEQLNGVSVVAVRPASEGRNEVLIIDYWRQYKDGQVSVTPKITATGETTNCYACHKAPVMPFYPTRGFTFDSYGKMVDQDPARTTELREYLNQQLADYGPPFFGGLLQPDAFGPGIGPLDRERSDAFLARCTADWPGVHRGKVAEAMKCGLCHDGNLMGKINFPQAVPSDRDAHSTGGLGSEPWRTLTFVETFVQLGYMPPGQSPALTADEKSALSHCLLTEYFDPDTKTGLLYEWLRNELD